MKRSGREEQAIRSIHSNLLYIIVAAVIIALIVLFNFSRQGLLGPIRGDSNRNPAVIWSVTDHRLGTNNSLLINDINGSDLPEYIQEGIVPLQRDSNGDLVALPRVQGTLEYYKNPSND